LVNPTTITTDNGSAKFTFEFSSTEGQTQMVRYTTDGPIWQLVEVTAWLRYKEFEFPKSATITRKREGRVFQTIRYDLIKLVDKPEELLTWHGWSEGSIVNDFRSNPVSIRVYSKGQLIHDPRFDDRSATDLSWRRMLVILAAAVVALWLIFAVRTLLRRRGALPNKSEGSV
jgi:hypothetical protein